MFCDSKALPVEMYISGDKPAVNQLYSTSMLGPYVQLFVLDHRRGYLGKEQGTWLRETLSVSTARFKIILSGTPFGATSSSCHSKASAGRSQSSETSTDTLPKTVAVESTEIPLTVKDISTSSATHSAAVTMQIPLPILSLGIDDGGRPNLSLAGILAAYQLSCMAKTSGKSTHTYCASPEISGKHIDTDLKGDNDKHNKRINDKMKNSQENISSANESGEFPTIYTESGILILSAGACVPHQNTKSALFMGTEDHSAGIQDTRSPGVSGKESTSGSHESDSNLRVHQEGEDDKDYNDADNVLEPYLASCDPQGVGRPFCVELCVGGGGGLGGAAEVLLPPMSIPSIGVTMLYNVSIQPSIPDSLECPQSSSGKYAGIVTLSDNASSLDLQLLAVKSTQKHDIIYRCTMRAASSTLM